MPLNPDPWDDVETVDSHELERRISAWGSQQPHRELQAAAYRLIAGVDVIDHAHTSPGLIALPPWARVSFEKLGLIEPEIIVTLAMPVGPAPWAMAAARGHLPLPDREASTTSTWKSEE